MIAGVDGFRGGWIAVVERDDGRTELRTVSHVHELTADVDLTHIAIDIPIGLVAAGRRHCDSEARAFLGPRWMCVFLAPTWSMLEAARADVNTVALRDRGTRTSAQERAIYPKIREVNDHIAGTTALQGRIREAHPEVIFRAMRSVLDADGAPLAPKKRPDGEHQRCALLRRLFHDFESNLSACPRRVRRDDVIDAYACLWTARRIRDGVAERFPKLHPIQEHRGLRAEIMY